MDLTVFDGMDEDQLRNYLGFLLWHYRVVDAFWFIYVGDVWGQENAERINEKVWSRVPEMGAQSLMQRFGITEKGLRGFAKVLKLFPWTIIVEYEFQENDNELIITIPHCPTQEARLKRGLGEFACKHMHKGEFESIARAVDPAIKVECVFAPPDEHPDNIFCKWRFTVNS
ncbi:MAG: DUF6125 family protein [Syntrophorhabdaceae bacterium]